MASCVLSLSSARRNLKLGISSGKTLISASMSRAEIRCLSASMWRAHTPRALARVSSRRSNSWKPWSLCSKVLSCLACVLRVSRYWSFHASDRRRRASARSDTAESRSWHRSSASTRAGPGWSTRSGCCENLDKLPAFRMLAREQVMAFFSSLATTEKMVRCLVAHTSSLAAPDSRVSRPSVDHQRSAGPSTRKAHSSCSPASPASGMV
mmetsp:Transcript_1158/g.3580  ORF Transcript_1158/g.3580 Transcript_1158/m.3580 type:complete len:209 (+) Transcript_1158:1350-1976(+)